MQLSKDKSEGEDLPDVGNVDDDLLLTFDDDNQNDLLITDYDVDCEVVTLTTLLL